ncbi:MAG TPA: AAA family ATPase [Symbiobacteriaceae bacterium]|nr:AAA family ATPase [Symbiobacteriaceae bacterium]
MIAEDRQIRIFVSSTFSDMVEERNILAKVVFPALRKRCAERGVTLVDVDLRWGVTEETHAISHCLDEIAGCRPFFIGILGERYGSVLPLSVELLEREPWLSEFRDRSVTELEFLHGVLRHPHLAQQAYFYFRDPNYVGTVRDSTGDKLDTLKARIRTSGRPVTENYADPPAFGRAVLQDFEALIDKLYPVAGAPSLLMQEAQEHAAFSRSRTRLFVGRDLYLDALDDYVQSSAQPLILTGESGVGKSAVLAAWAERYQPSHPEAMLLVHFVGATTYSADWRVLVRRVLGEIQRCFGVRVESSDDETELRAALAYALELAAASGPIVLALDGLNQLEDKDQALELAWLPHQLPRGLKLVCSALDGPALTEARRRVWTELPIGRMTEDEVRTFVIRYLAECGRKLSAANLERVASARLATNPLYLKAVLDELRIQSSHVTLAADLDGYLAVESVADLFDMVLARYERDYEEFRTGLVREAMSLLWAARRGLSEVEILELLGEEDEPLPRAHFSPLFLAVDSWLVNRNGLLSFAHQHLRDAVERRYLASDEAKRIVRTYVATYFHNQSVDTERILPRVLDELPWQLHAAGEWPWLTEVLADPDILEALFQRDEFEVQRHWAAIERHSDIRMLAVYERVLLEPDDWGHAVTSVAALLERAGHLEQAKSIFSKMAREYADGDDLPRFSSCMAAFVRISHIQGNLDDAMSTLDYRDRLLQPMRQSGDLLINRADRASIMMALGELDGALELFREQAALDRRLGRLAGRARCLSGQAWILNRRGNLDGAMALHMEEERLHREVGDHLGLAGCLGNMAAIWLARNDPDRALPLAMEEERICRELGYLVGLHRSLSRKATIMLKQGELDAAMSQLKEEERICRELEAWDGLQACLGNQAQVLKARGDMQGALSLSKTRRRLCENDGNRFGLHEAHAFEAAIFIETRYPKAAMEPLSAQEGICRELGLWGSLLENLDQQATVVLLMRDMAWALSIGREAEKVYPHLGDQSGPCACLRIKALLAEVISMLDRPIPFSVDAETASAQRGADESLATSLKDQALVLDQIIESCTDVPGHSVRPDAHTCLFTGTTKPGDALDAIVNREIQSLVRRGDKDGALQMLKGQEQSLRNRNDAEGVLDCLDRQIELLIRYDHVRALAALKRKENVYLLLGRPKEVAESIFFQVDFVSNKEEALSLARRALALAKRCGAEDLAEWISDSIEDLEGPDE